MHVTHLSRVGNDDVLDWLIAALGDSFLKEVRICDYTREKRRTNFMDNVHSIQDGTENNVLAI